MTLALDPLEEQTTSVAAPIVRRSFDDHEQFSSALSGWIPIARKLDRGPFAASLLQMDLGDVRVVHARVDSLLEIEGIAAPGFQSFGIPARACTQARWCGRNVSGGRFVNSFDASGSFDALITPGFETFVVSVRKDLLRERGASLEIPVETTFGGAKVSEYDSTSLRALLTTLHTASRHSLAGPATQHAAAALRELICFELPGRLVELQGAGKPETPLPSRVRHHVLEQARVWIALSPADGYTVANLCRGIGAGERTLRRAFLDYYGVTPRDYLKARRLDHVHHELLAADPAHGLVSDIANRWGFWHLGQLAADYRHFYDELPSETLERVS